MALDDLTDACCRYFQLTTVTGLLPVGQPYHVTVGWFSCTGESHYWQYTIILNFVTFFVFLPIKQLRRIYFNTFVSGNAVNYYSACFIRPFEIFLYAGISVQ